LFAANKVARKAAGAELQKNFALETGETCILLMGYSSCRVSAVARVDDFFTFAEPAGKLAALEGLALPG
jgi:hypothetical protein